MIGTTSPSFLAAYVGESVVIACFSFAEVLWTKAGERVKQANAKVSFNYMALSNLTLRDNGVYSCHGSTNVGGTDTFTANTTVFIGSEA